MKNGGRVSGPREWTANRRPEILRMFEENVYGKAPIERPAGMHWRTTAENPNALDGSAVKKNVTLFFSERDAWPKCELELLLPKSKTPVPVFLVSTWGPDARLLVKNGFGLVLLDAREIEPDNKDEAYANGIRKYFDPPGRMAPDSAEWGTVSMVLDAQKSDGPHPDRQFY